MRRSSTNWPTRLGTLRTILESATTQLDQLSGNRRRAQFRRAFRRLSELAQHLYAESGHRCDHVDKPAASPALVCPIWGTGIDAATPATDCTNEVQTTPPNCYIDITNTTLSIPAAANTIAKTIAHQLVEHGRSWKSYQENLPSGGADGVNYSDGFFTNNTNFASFLTTPSSFTSWSAQNITVPAIMTQSDANNDIVYLYAAKHNPFVYFRDVQESTNPRNSLSNVVGFNSLYQDLGSGDVPLRSSCRTSATTSTGAATPARLAILTIRTTARRPV